MNFEILIFNLSFPKTRLGQSVRKLLLSYVPPGHGQLTIPIPPMIHASRNSACSNWRANEPF
ncbi:hypothetical protein [Methylomonas albis]|nr:hypothetical protein [Methylomonas albis]